MPRDGPSTFLVPGQDDCLGSGFLSKPHMLSFRRLFHPFLQRPCFHWPPPLYAPHSAPHPKLSLCASFASLHIIFISLCFAQSLTPPHHHPIAETCPARVVQASADVSY
mmetsp:Transcript_37266/g.99208  ORF Transcript_37266/g.99208 Transcript_37266/m.99208 type:complete len:109 (-) Transcript_37266:84-410(-)